MYAADDNYAWIAGISLLSFFECNKGTMHNIYILNNGISKDNKDKISELVKKYNSNVLFIDVKEILSQIKQKLINSIDPTYNMSYFARLIAVDLLPKDVEKILYLDCDTLIVKDISELEEIQMNKALLMRPDCIQKTYRKTIDMSTEVKYYNSGLIMINVPMWKKHHCTETFVNYIEHEKKAFPLFDQDIINKALYDEIEDFNIYGYNCQSQMFLFDYKNCLKAYDLNKENYITEEDYYETTHNPKILHFCGNSFMRPWYVNSNHPYTRKWMDYLKMSPWANKKIEKYNASFPNKVRYFLHRYCPKNIEVIITRIAYRCFILFVYKV